MPGDDGTALQPLVKTITTFRPSRQDERRAVVFQPDGKRLLAGIAGDNLGLYRATASWPPRRRVRRGRLGHDRLRCHPDAAYGVIAQSDGGAIVAGGNASHLVVARYDAAGTIGPSFRIVLPSDGPARAVAALPDGSVDTSFGYAGRVTSDLVSRPRSMVSESDGTIVVAGERDPGVASAAFRPDGSVDRAWGTDAGRTITSFGDPEPHAEARREGSTR